MAVKNIPIYLRAGWDLYVEIRQRLKNELNDDVRHALTKAFNESTEDQQKMVYELAGIPKTEVDDILFRAKKGLKLGRAALLADLLGLEVKIIVTEKEKPIE